MQRGPRPQGPGNEFLQVWMPAVCQIASCKWSPVAQIPAAHGICVACGNKVLVFKTKAFYKPPNILEQLLQSPAFGCLAAVGIQVCEPEGGPLFTYQFITSWLSIETLISAVNGLTEQSLSQGVKRGEQPALPVTGMASQGICCLPQGIKVCPGFVCYDKKEHCRNGHQS